MKKTDFYLSCWTSDDITFCTAECGRRCARKPAYIHHKSIPHSFSDLSEVCSEYAAKEARNEV